MRDHDVISLEMHSFVSLAHTVFNAGLGISWENNNKEIRNFVPLNDLITYLEIRGFKNQGVKLLQKHDPSMNTLLEFVKV